MCVFQESYILAVAETVISQIRPRPACLIRCQICSGLSASLIARAGLFLQEPRYTRNVIYARTAVGEKHLR